jgi:hypothetical protein
MKRTVSSYGGHRHTGSADNSGGSASANESNLVVSFGPHVLIT